MLKQSLKALVFGAALTGMGAVSAATHSGKIVTVHNNGTVQDRGMCFRMDPAVPVNGGWACLYRANFMFKEITATVLAAYMHAGRDCTVWWREVDASGRAIVDTVECS